MSFPTTSVLDNFARDDGALSGAWGSSILPGDPRLKIVSDQAVPAVDGSYADQVYGGPVTGAVEVWAAVTGVDGAPWVWACVQNAGTPNVTGYAFGAASGVSLTLSRCDAGPAFTTLHTWAQTVGAGDAFGLAIAAGVITAYYKSSGGSWTSVGTVDDSTYSAGQIGLGVSESNATPAAFTEFGGTLSAIAPVTRRGLYVTLTKLDGTPWEQASTARPLPVSTVDQPQVTIPLSDSRTGQIAVSMQERVAAALPSNAGQCVMKVLYVNPKSDSTLLINGIVTNPESDFDAETVTCQIHDSSIRLKRRYLGYNHASIILSDGQFALTSDGTSYSEAILANAGLSNFYDVRSSAGIPLDGKGLRLLLLDTSHGAADWEGWPYPTDDSFSGVPAMGIRYQPGYSVDDANRQPVYDSNGNPPLGFPLTADVSDGDATLTNVTLPDGVTIDDVYEYGALSGPGIPDFANVVSASSTSDGDIIVMSKEATADHSAAAVQLEDAIYAQLSRGDCVYDDWGDIVQAQGAFECDFIPVDATHTGKSGATWVAGQLCELYTANRIGVDRSFGNTEGNIPVQFVHGLGGFHLVHSPDADSLITYEVQVSPGGPDSPGDSNARVTLESGTLSTLGFWEDWEQATSAGTGDTTVGFDVLTNRANAMLVAYQQVPDFITATVDTDVVGAYAFGTDFFLGDTVTVYGKRGYCQVGPLAVRITQVQIAQVDHDGNCQITLTMVPYITTDPGATPDGGGS